MTDDENDRYNLIAECGRLADGWGEAAGRAEALERRLRVAEEALSLARAEGSERPAEARHTHEWHQVPKSEWSECRGCGWCVSRERDLGHGVAIHEWRASAGLA